MPRREQDGAIELTRPRYFNFPLVLKGLDARLMARCVSRDFRTSVEAFGPTLVDAHWGYPDGVAAAALARAAGLPYFITVRGDDMTVFLDTRARRAQMVAAMNGAHAVIGVCQALVDVAIAAGVDPRRCTVVPNGVDPETFYPEERTAAREALEVDARRPLLLSVGHISERKGFHLLVEALSRLDSARGREAQLAIVGGPGGEPDFTEALRATVERHGLGSRVIMPGPATPDRLRLWYSAADLFCLASSREGWPNVLLESLACGCPAVATRVGGIPEVLSDPEIGRVVERDADSLARAIDGALARDWDRARLVAHAGERGWSRTASGCLNAFERFLGADPRG